MPAARKQKKARKPRFNNENPSRYWYGPDPALEEATRSRRITSIISVCAIVVTIVLAIIGYVAADLSTVTDEEFRDRAEEIQVPPSGPGPWQFDVVDTGEVGLIVRTTPGQDGQQVGTASNHATVWAECKITTDFDPVASDDLDGVWYRIRWPNNKSGVATPLNSAPGAPYRAFVYGGFVIPDGHNGQITNC